MAETTKNYVSKYSGDQLDAAIAVLGSLRAMFFSQSEFDKFINQFNIKMAGLTSDVGAMTSKAEASINAANEAKTQAENTTTAASAVIDKVTELAGKGLIFYDDITNEVK